MNAVLREALAPTRRACGSLNVRIMDEACVLRCSGAMWVPGRHAMIVADLHLEKGSAYAAGGQMLPPYDSRATLTALEAEVATLDPAVVVLLGDSFHDRRALERLAVPDLRQIERLAAGRDWVWLTGNHDHEALRSDGGRATLPGGVVETMSLGPLSLTHAPEPGDRPGEVAGHLHPCARVSAHHRGVRRACFVTDGRRIVLPAFGAYAGGLDVRNPEIAGLFDAPPMIAALGRDKVHALAWTSLS